MQLNVTEMSKYSRVTGEYTELFREQNIGFYSCPSLVYCKTKLQNYYHQFVHSSCLELYRLQLYQESIVFL